MSLAGKALRRGLGWWSGWFVVLVLSGCATPPSPVSAGDASAKVSAPVTEAPASTTVAAARPTAAGAPPPEGQPYLFALDPLRPSVIIESVDPSARTDLWVRVRSGFAMPDLDNALVLKWQQYYASRPDYVKRMTERGGRYLFYVVEEIEKRGMPTELALLPFIESAFNPQAMSVARASGMWQFMPATGKDFDLKQNLFRDDRRDVLASTRAALDYLQMLQRQFGDWQLALAAYNWGQGSVQRAIDRNLKAGLPATYEELRMPDETRNYVPKLQAVKNIVMAPQAFSITLPVLENHPYFLTVPITNDIDVDVAARLAGISLDEFQQLNPQMNKPVILAAGTPQVLLPYNNATLFLANLRTHRAPLATWTAWVSPATLKPADVARQVGMSEAELRAVNRIPPRMLVKTGSTLLVPRSPHKSSDVSEQVADNAMMLLAPEQVPGKRISFKAGKGGDSVASVATRHRVSAAQVAQWNGVDADARFKPGQTIVIIKPVAASRGKASAAVASARPPAAKAPAKRTAAARPAPKSNAKVAVTKPDSKL
jgi:membrane-bound lytic murein transglycosylase D